jgi:hypothetical protein
METIAVGILLPLHALQILNQLLATRIDASVRRMAPFRVPLRLGGLLQTPLSVKVARWWRDR